MLLTSGRETMLAFKGYAAVLIWIQLWPPLYAVLNYMASIYAAYDLAAAADLGSGGQRPCRCRQHRRSTPGRSPARPWSATSPSASRSSPGRRSEADGDLWHRAGGRGLSGLQSMVAGATAACRRGQSEHGQCLDGQIRLAPNRTSRVHEQLAERHQRQHLLVEHADRPDRRQPAAQPGLRVPGRLDARERT